MHWPDPAPILADLELPAGLTARPLARGDLAAVCAWLTAHDPQLAVGDAAELLEPDFYAHEVALAGEDHPIADRPSFAVVLVASEAIAGCLVLEYELAEHALFRRLAAAAPAHARHWLDAEERFGRALGAKVVYGFVALVPAKLALAKAGGGTRGRSTICAVPRACVEQLVSQAIAAERRLETDCTCIGNCA